MFGGILLVEDLEEAAVLRADNTIGSQFQLFWEGSLDEKSWFSEGVWDWDPR